ncbi:TetR/AcrR family transcriptional regulator [Myxococcota bacterium]|nr:TetR/AcrR family transcriptional regulator [Myxococcota bacterium]
MAAFLLLGSTEVRLRFFEDFMARSSPESVQRAAQDKRQLILDAATHVFAEKGYHGSRISDIAREAGIAYGLVYHYFKNKEEILNSIFDDQWMVFLETVQQIVSGRQATEQKLLAIAELILNAHRVRSEWVKVLVFEIQRSQRFAQPDRLRAVSELFGLVGQIFRDGQASKALRQDIDPDLACAVFMGGLDIMVTNSVLPHTVKASPSSDDGTHYPDLAQTVVEIFLGGMLRGEACRR